MIGLNRRLRVYREENATNLTSRRVVLRADSAFGAPEVLQRLLELGYDFALKSFSGSNADYKPLFDAIGPEQWIEVGKNCCASAAINAPVPQLLGPYPLRLIALRRTDVDGRAVRSIVVTTFAADVMSPAELVDFYHERQTIEAGFQECKGTFHFEKPRLRKYEVNAAFTQLVLLAFNLVRWARSCMQTTATKLAEAKTRLLVKIAARCRASIRQTGDTLRILVSRGTSLAGLEIVLNRAPDYPFALSNGPMSGNSRET